MTKYLPFVEQLVAEGKTTGANQSDKMIEYTQLALKRMQRWNKVGELLPETKQTLALISTKQTWLVITEAWCGDAAHAYMFIQKMADENSRIELIWKLRDENPDLIDQYLTNGGRSIPKLIVYNEDGKELFNWGPRPAHIQEKFLEMRNEGIDHDTIMTELQKMYNKDKGLTTQREIIALLRQTLN